MSDDCCPPHSKPLNALLLCGGGSRGAIEVGFFKALRELGISINLIFGTSIGAINGAFIASGFMPDELATLWNRLEGRKLFRFNRQVLWKWGKVESLYRPDWLIGFLESALPAKRFEELKVPLVITATNLQTARPVYFDSGELMPAILASTAMPPYLPPVEYQGQQLVDGGFVANVPIGEAIARGAKRIFALLCHCSQEIDRPTRGFLEIQARVLRIALEQKFRHDLEHYKDQAELIVLEPCFDFPPSILKIERIQSLIEQGYRFATADLARRQLEGPMA